MEENKISADLIFKRWVASVREDRLSQYQYGERKKHIDNLIGALFANGVPQDEAEFLKRKVVETLVTKEGMKGNGKYRGWKENAEADFDDAIQLAYVPEFQKEKKSYQMSKTFTEDPNIVKWCKDTFGADVDTFTLKEAHTIGNTLNIMFLNSFYKRNTGGRL